MLAPWKRGAQTARVAKISRLRAAVAAVTLSGTLGLMSFSQVGCDSEANKANKALQAAVDSAREQQKTTKANDAAVIAALQQQPVNNPDKAAEALTSLSNYDATRPETLGEWNTAANGLSIYQREAIGRALRKVSVEDRMALVQAMAEATKTAGASAEAQIDPLMRLATLEGAVADELQREASDYEVEAAHLVDQAFRLLAQLRLNTARVAEYQLREPAPALADLEALRSKIVGSAPDAVWMAGENASMPAQSQVQANLEKAKAELEKLNAQRTEQVAKATQLRQQAAALSEEANKDTGDIAYNKLIEASKLRQEATTIDLAVQQLDSQIMNAQHELLIAEARQPTINTALDLLKIRKERVEENWKTVQELIGQVQADSKKLVYGADPSAPPATRPAEVALAKGSATPASQPADPAELQKLAADNYLVAKLEQLRQAAATAQELRGRAGDLYQSALKHLQDARESAGTARANLKERKDLRPTTAGDRTTFDTRAAFVDEALFVYREAELRQRLARVYADRAIGLALRNDLRQAALPVLQKAGIEPIPPIVNELPNLVGKDQTEGDANAGPDQVVANAVKKADETFEQVIKSLSAFLENSQEEQNYFERNPDSPRGRVTKGALALLVEVAFARAQVLAACGDKSAEEKLDAAVGFAKAYRTTYENELPRYLPTRLAEKLGVQPTQAPSLTPASAPATAPATTEPSTPLFNPDGTPAAPPAPGAPTPGVPTPGVPAPVPAPAGSTVPADWVQQTIPNTTYTFKTPGGWTVKPSAAGIVLQSAANDGTTVSAAANMTPAGVTLQSLTESVPTSMAGILPDFKAVSAALTTIGGKQAAEIVYDATVDGAAMRTIEIKFIIGSDLVEITGNTPPTNFDTVAPIFRQIAGTISSPTAPGAPTPGAPAPVPAPGAPTPAPVPAPAPAPGGETPAPPPAPGGETPAPAPAPDGAAPTPAPPPGGETPAPAPAPGGETPVPTPAEPPPSI